MRELLLKRWAKQPWHSWLKNEPKWLNLFAELWARLPESAVKKILGTPFHFIILPPVHHSHVMRIETPLPLGAHILQLNPNLLERKQTQTIAILAHELAHLCTEPSADALYNDLEADRLAQEWGFGQGLDSALTEDLGLNHPRLLALRKCAE